MSSFQFIASRIFAIVSGKCCCKYCALAPKQLILLSVKVFVTAFVSATSLVAVSRGEDFLPLKVKVSLIGSLKFAKGLLLFSFLGLNVGKVKLIFPISIKIEFLIQCIFFINTKNHEKLLNKSLLVKFVYKIS